MKKKGEICGKKYCNQTLIIIFNYGKQISIRF